VLKVLADYDLVNGKTVGIDGTTLEANAAMRSIVRKDTKQNYQEFLTELARASGIDTPTREELATLDAFASAREHAQTNVGARGRVQSEPGHAPVDRHRQTPAMAGSFCVDFGLDRQALQRSG
jgi:hypothetical protein